MKGVGRGTESLSCTWAELNYSVDSGSLAAALQACPGSWGEQEPTRPSPPRPMHLLRRPAAPWPARPWLREQEPCTGPRTSVHSLPAGLLPLSRHLAKSTASPQEGWHLARATARSGTPYEQGVSRAAMSMFVVLINVVILRFSCP